jgi:hypothetical protein
MVGAAFGPSCAPVAHAEKKNVVAWAPFKGDERADPKIGTDFAPPIEMS